MKTILPKTLFEGERFFHSLGAVLLLISCTFLVCHTPKNILNVYDLFCLAVKVRSMRSMILVEGSLHDPPPLSNLGVPADSGQPSPSHRQRLLQHPHLLPEGQKNNSVSFLFSKFSRGVPQDPKFRSGVLEHILGRPPPPKHSIEPPLQKVERLSEQEKRFLRMRRAKLL